MQKFVVPFVAAVGFVSLLLFLMAGSGHQSGRLALDAAQRLMQLAGTVGIGGTGLSLFYVIWQRPRGLLLGLVFLSAISGLASYFLSRIQQ